MGEGHVVNMLNISINPKAGFFFIASLLTANRPISIGKKRLLIYNEVRYVKISS
jgi:hypothetical protein